MIARRHSWRLTPRQAIALQSELAAQVLEVALPRPVRTVAGADCAFIDGGRRIVAAAVLCEARTLAVIAARTVIRRCRFPYVPGLLSFREAPAVIQALSRLPLRPDLVLCDGQGRAHPRRIGLASHVGWYLDLPTIGVAKSRLCGRHRAPGPRRGSKARLVDHDEQVGWVLRTRDNAAPLYVSVGHRVLLSEALRWTLKLAPRHRLPEPARLAHLLVSRVAREHTNNAARTDAEEEKHSD